MTAGFFVRISPAINSINDRDNVNQRSNSNKRYAAHEGEGGREKCIWKTTLPPDSSFDGQHVA